MGKREEQTKREEEIMVYVNPYTLREVGFPSPTAKALTSECQNFDRVFFFYFFFFN